MLLALWLLAQTTTTEVQRMVGEPLPVGVVLGSGLVILVVIVGAGLLVRQQTQRRR